MRRLPGWRRTARDPPPRRQRGRTRGRYPTVRARRHPDRSPSRSRPSAGGRSRNRGSRRGPTSDASRLPPRPVLAPPVARPGVRPLGQLALGPAVRLLLAQRTRAADGAPTPRPRQLGQPRLAVGVRAAIGARGPHGFPPELGVAKWAARRHDGYSAHSQSPFTCPRPRFAAVAGAFCCQATCAQVRDGIAKRSSQRLTVAMLMP